MSFKRDLKDTNEEAVLICKVSEPTLKKNDHAKIYIYFGTVKSFWSEHLSDLDGEYRPFFSW